MTELQLTENLIYLGTFDAEWRKPFSFQFPTTNEPTCVYHLPGFYRCDHENVYSIYKWIVNYFYKIKQCIHFVSFP